MKRSAFLVIGFLVAFIVGLPYFMGIVAQKNINRVLMELQEKTNNKRYPSVQIDFDSIEFNRGWFTSDVKISGKVFPSQSKWFSSLDEKGNNFVIKSSLKHGPLLFVYDMRHASKLGSVLVNSNISLDIKNGQSKIEQLPIEAITDISVFGYFTHFLKFPGHKEKLNSLLSIEWLDTDIEISHSREINNFDLELDVDNVQLSHLILGQLILKDLNIHKAFSNKGDAFVASQLIIDEASFVSITGHNTTLEEFSLEIMMSSDQNQLTDIFVFLNVDKLHSFAGDFAGTFGIKLNNLNFAALDKSDSDSTNSMTDDEHGLKGFNTIKKIITKETNIIIEPFKLGAHDGKAELNGKIKPKFPWPNAKEVTNLWNLTERVNFVLVSSKSMIEGLAKYALKIIERDKLLKRADHSNPVAFLKEKAKITQQQVNAAIQKWQKDGFLKIDDDQYYLEFSYANNIFNINGNNL